MGWEPSGAEVELNRLGAYIETHFIKETPTHESPVSCAIRLLDELRARRLLHPDEELAVPFQWGGKGA